MNRQKVATTVIGTLLMASLTGPARAADWSFDPKVTASYEFDDNHRRTDEPGREIKVSGAALDAQLTVRARTPRTTFQLVPRARSTVFPGDSQDETDDQYLRMLLDHRAERSRVQLLSAYSRVETLGYYGPQPGIGEDDVLGEPGQGEGLGRSTGTNREERFEFAPRVAFDLGERTAIELGAGYLDVDFDQQVASDREDFKNVDGSVAFRYRLSPNRTVALRGAASRYEPDSSTSRDTLGLGVEWTNRVSETSQVYLLGGASRVETGGGSSWETTFTGGAGVRWSFEVTELFLDGNRQLNPDSSGRIIERDTVRFQLSRRISPLATVTFGLRGIRDGRTGQGDTFERREYMAALVGFNWRMTRQLSLGGRYQYFWRDYADRPHAATANSVSLGVTWEPNQR